MKAQSGLAGDRKRRAEMARSHICGVTNRIDSISEMMSVPTICTKEIIPEISFPKVDLPKVEFSPALTEALTALSGHKLCTEVNHRPAGQ